MPKASELQDTGSEAPSKTGAANGGMYAINRIDMERHGQDAWHVHLHRGGRSIQMTFSDSTYGGKLQALEVATAYRDAVLRVVPPLTNSQLRQRVRKNHPSESNMPGVYFSPNSGSGKQGAWIARIEINADTQTLVTSSRRQRKAITRTYSVGKFGFDEAKRLAEEERIRMLGSLENADEPALRSMEGLRLSRHHITSLDDHDDARAECLCGKQL